MYKTYKTRQRASILEYLEQNNDKHITADDIIEHFKKIENPIGKSTVYRYLDSLVAENRIRKYVTPESGTAACYQYVKNVGECQSHYHMKCVKCGNLIHLDCDEINELTEHIYKEHRFKIDLCKTVLYGYCNDCV